MHLQSQHALERRLAGLMIKGVGHQLSVDEKLNLRPPSDNAVTVPILYSIDVQRSNPYIRNFK